jgi:hypothetical protein
MVTFQYMHAYESLEIARHCAVEATAEGWLNAPGRRASGSCAMALALLQPAGDPGQPCTEHRSGDGHASPSATSSFRLGSV